MPLMVLFALIGLIVGGVRGLLIGAAIGYAAGWVLRNVLGKQLVLVQAQFLESTFAVMGAVCKADGAVSRDEIQVAESMFARLNLSSEQRQSAMAAFTRGKAPGFDLDAEVGKFARASRGHRPILLMFMQIQCAAVAADGNIHPAEHQMLVRVARGLGLSEADVAQLEALLRTGAPGPSPQTKLADAYAALGISSSASDAEIKQAYRRLMSQNHPDKLAGKGLPESMREMAEERSREISTAYALIKEARGFV
jgi:DnaJ like chaperone protein